MSHRPFMNRLLITSVVAATALTTLAGCTVNASGELPENKVKIQSSDGSRTEDSGAKVTVKAGDSIVVSLNKSTVAVTCEGENAEVELLGANGTATLEGACGSVDISSVSTTVNLDRPEKISLSGASNKVTFDSAHSLSVMGADNRVTYTSLATQADVTGINNTVKAD